ncbi:MAG: lactonase family protein [Caldilineaceae bacterium]
MYRRLSILLAVVLVIIMVTPALAQEAATAARAVYLPLVVGQGQSANVSEAPPAEEDLTDSLADVEAANQSNSGLVFVGTNAADPIRGNEIVMYQRAANGALTLSGRFPTGGQGLGSGLGSQDSVILSKNGRWLFVVNAGSNEISVFAVQPVGLVLTDKIASGGVRPTSLTVRKNRLYVLNAGDPGNITGFQLASNGKLTPLANSTRFLSNNGVGTAPAPAQVSFSPDGSVLIVTERATNLLDLYPVNQHGVAGNLTSYPSAGTTPFGFSFADEDTLVVSEAFGGAPNASAASSYTLANGQLQLVSASVPTGETAACWIIISKDGKLAYTTNAGSASLSGYSVGDGGQLSLLAGRAGETGVGTGPTDASKSRNGRLFYVLSPRSQTVVAFELKADGSLFALGSFGGLQANAAGIAAW